MKDKATIRVRIGNMTYHLSARENPQYIEGIAEEADRVIQQIRQTNPSLNTVHVAVLGLVNALDQKAKLEQNASSRADGESKQNIQLKYDEANRERMELREACWDLKKELVYYKNLCELYEEKIEELNKLVAADTMPLKKVVRQEFNPLDELQTSLEDLAEVADKESKFIGPERSKGKIQAAPTKSPAAKLGLASK